MDIVAAVRRADERSIRRAGEVGLHDLLPQRFDLPGGLLGGTAELPDLTAGNAGVVRHERERDGERIRSVYQKTH